MKDPTSKQPFQLKVAGRTSQLLRALNSQASVFPALWLATPQSGTECVVTFLTSYEVSTPGPSAGETEKPTEKSSPEV